MPHHLLPYVVDDLENRLSARELEIKYGQKEGTFPFLALNSIAHYSIYPYLRGYGYLDLSQLPVQQNEADRTPIVLRFITIKDLLQKTLPENQEYPLDSHVKNLVNNGWTVIKTGPARTEEGFQFYTIPIRIIMSFWNRYDDDFYLRWADVVHEEEKARAPGTETPAADSKTEPAAEQDDAFEKLKKLKDLLDNEVITQEEYDKKKKELMDQM